MVDAEPLVNRILDDEGLTGDLDEAQAEALVKWLVAQTEEIARTSNSTAKAGGRVAKLRQTGRQIAKLVATGAQESLTQVAALPWPPPADVPPADALAWLLTQIDARTQT